MTNEQKGYAFLTAIAIVVIAFFCAITANGCGANYSDGERVGELRKFSRKGYICKSWEGELLLSSGYIRRSDGSGGPDIWKFSVADESIAKELQLRSGRTVRLQYREWAIKPAWQDTDYSIVGINAK